MLNHKQLVKEIAKSCYCNKRDLPDLIIHELRHMGLNTDDMQKCKEEIKVYVKEIV